MWTAFDLFTVFLVWLMADILLWEFFQLFRREREQQDEVERHFVDELTKKGRKRCS